MELKYYQPLADCLKKDRESTILQMGMNRVTVDITKDCIIEDNVEINKFEELLSCQQKSL